MTLGVAVEVLTTTGRFTTAITAVNMNANAVVAATNSSNDPPSAGNVYVIATVTSTFLGPGEKANLFEIPKPKFLDNRAKGTSIVAAVIPNSWNDVGDLFQGAKAVYNVAFLVGVSDLDPAVLYFDEGGKTVFFSVR